MIALATSDAPALSVVVAFTADAPRARRCLAHVAAALDGGPVAYEVVAVDNGARAEVGAVLRDEVTGHRLLVSREDLGIPVAWAQGIGMARAERILLFHEDTEIQPETFPELAAVMDADPLAGAVAARVHTPDGRIQSAGRIVWRDGRDTPIRAAAALDALEPFPVDRPASATVLLRRDAYDATGGFDPSFFPAVCVDADLGVALWATGAKVVCAPRARSVHVSGAMVQEDGGPWRSALFSHFLQERAFAHMAEKWDTELTRFAAREDGVEASLAAARVRAETATGWASVARPDHPARDLDVAHVDPVLEADAARLRAAVNEEFVSWLVARDDVLHAEIAWRDTRIAELERNAEGAEAHLAEVTARLQDMGDRLLAAQARLTRPAGPED